MNEWRVTFDRNADAWRNAAGKPFASLELSFIDYDRHVLFFAGLNVVDAHVNGISRCRCHDHRALMTRRKATEVQAGAIGHHGHNTLRMTENEQPG